MKYTIQKNSTGVILPIFLQDLSSPIGAGLSGVLYNSSGLSCYYKKNTDSSVSTVTLVNGTVGTYASSSFIRVNDSLVPGDVELCLPNAAFVAPASGNYFLTATLRGVANMLPVKIDIQLVDPATSGSGGGPISEPSAVPSFPCTADAMVSWLFARATNLETCTATGATVFKSDDTTPIASTTLSDDGTTLVRTRYN